MNDKQLATIARVRRALDVAIKQCDEKRAQAVVNGESNAIILGRTVPPGLSLVVRQSVSELEAILAECGVYA